MIERDMELQSAASGEVAPHRWPISIEFRGRTIEGWYCIENGGVSVHHVNSNGIVRSSWAATPYNDWDSMARIVLREVAEENERRNRGALAR